MQPWRNSLAAEAQQALCQHDRQLPDLITLGSSSTVYICKHGIPSYQCCFHHCEKAYLHLKAKDVRFNTSAHPSDNASIGLFRHLGQWHSELKLPSQQLCHLPRDRNKGFFLFFFFFLKGGGKEGRRQMTH